MRTMIETLYITDSDELREKQIHSELTSMQCCAALGNRDQATVHWREFVRLVKQRSARKVSQMERERGL